MQRFRCVVFWSRVGPATFCTTAVRLRVGTKKPTVDHTVDPTSVGMTADVVPRHTNKIRTPESTVVRRPTSRKAFGNRVDDKDLLDADFKRSVETGLKVNIEVSGVDGANDPMRPTGKASEVGRGGRLWEKTRLQPLNPHYNLDVYRSKKVIRRVRDGTTLFTSRDRLNHSHKLTDDQVNKFADSFAATKWYAPVWRAMRHFDLVRLKQYQLVAQVLAPVLFGIMLFIMYYLYFCEVNVFLQLEKRDQDDLRKMLQGIRISDFKEVGDEVSEQHDPLHIMPDKERMTLVIEECRRRGLVDKDWELEKRKRNSLIAEPDFLHIFYWACMYVGTALSGGGTGFWTSLEI